MENGKTYVSVSMDIKKLDDAVMEFIRKRNELAELAKKIGLLVEYDTLTVEKK